MALLKALCWALIFIIRIRFPPGTSLATVLMNIYLGISTLKYFEENLIRHRGGQETKTSC